MILILSKLEIKGDVMIIRSYCFFIVLFLSISPILFAKVPNDFKKEQITLVKTIETRNCFVSYVIIDGKDYIIKQKKDPKKQFAVVKDALAAWMAELLDIAHNVGVISYQKDMVGKVKKSFPATIHTIAPGDTVRAQKECKYNAIRLRQFWANAKKYEDKGLTKAIISYMTWHDQLPIIVALDLVIGNSDRHCGNLCYDPQTDTFCAIDMDDTFNKDLCGFACKKIASIFKNEKFTLEELKALSALRDTLALFVKKYKPKKIIAKLHFFSKIAGFVPGNKIYTSTIEKKIKLYEKMIAKTYVSAQKLIKLIDTIVKA